MAKSTLVRRCEGCNGEVLPVSQHLVEMLLRAETRWERVAAFECKNCQVVLFEDELLGGRFLPAEYRPLDTACDTNLPFARLHVDEWPSYVLDDFFIAAFR